MKGNYFLSKISIAWENSQSLSSQFDSERICNRKKKTQELDIFDEYEKIIDDNKFIISNKQK